MKRDQKIRLVTTVMLMAASVLNGLEVRGQTEQGSEFTGMLLSLHSGTLHFRSKNDSGRSPVGIPIDSLASLHLEINEPYPANLARQLESFVPVLQFLDRETRYALTGWARLIGESGDLAGAYLWSDRLANVSPEPDVRLGAGLVKAWSLWQMGLLRELGGQLEDLNQAIEPLEAPPLLCQLNSSYWEWRGDVNQSCFWRELPDLRIPSKQSPDY